MTQAANKAHSAAAASHARAPARHPAPRLSTSLSPVHGLQASAGNRAVSSAIGAGAPIPPDVREEMESRFGADFADVRIHDDSRAHTSAATLQANAYTHGHDIVFGAGRYAPHSTGGRRLIAHELAHVVQQRRGGIAPVLAANASHEAGADRAAATYSASAGPVAVQGATGVGVARDEDSIAGRLVGGAAQMAKRKLIDTIIGSIGVPPQGARLAAAVGRGMGEQFVEELVTQHRGADLLKNLASISGSDIDQLIKGYYVGLVEGLISPVTDLWGIVVLGERVQNLMKDLLASAFKHRNDVTQEFAELVEEAKHVRDSAGNLWSWIKEHPQEALTAVLSAPDALSEFAERKGYELGKAGASSIVASMEAPFKKPGEDKKEEEESDWIKAPAAAVEHLAKQGEDWVLDTPWSKIGSKVGYAIGFVAIQAVLIAFTEGIGDAIQYVAQGLGKVGAALGKFTKGVGAVVERVADFILEVGKGITVVEEAIAQLASKALDKVPWLQKLLAPVGRLFEKLKKFLRKLFGVAKNEGEAILVSTAKASNEIGDIASHGAPKPLPPPKPPPVVRQAGGELGEGGIGRATGAGGTGDKVVTPLARDKPPAASDATRKLQQNLQNKPTGSGSVSNLEPRGKPGRLPHAKSQPVPMQQLDEGKVAVGQTHGAGGPANDVALSPGGKAPQASAVRSGEPTVNARPGGRSGGATRARATDAGGGGGTRGAGGGGGAGRGPRGGTPNDPLVSVKIRGGNKGEYDLVNPGNARPGSDRIVLPKSEADALGFRPRGAPAKTTIQARVVNGEQAESLGAGRRTAGPEPRSKTPSHPISGRTTRAPGRGPKGGDLEMKRPNAKAAHAFPRTIGADVAQSRGYNALLEGGEKGLLRPGNVSTRGVDAITVRFGENGEAKIFLNDFTTPSVGKPAKASHALWKKQLTAAVKGDRLNLGDKALEDAVRRAIKNRNVFVRTVTVETLPEGAIVTTLGPERRL